MRTLKVTTRVVGATTSPRPTSMASPVKRPVSASAASLSAAPSKLRLPGT